MKPFVVDVFTEGDKNVVRCHRVGNCADGVRQGNPETPYAEL